MTSNSLPLPRFQQFKTLRALAIGLAIGFAAPAFADNLPEIQRLIKQGQYPQAMDKVDAYLSNKPKDAQGRFLKGLIYTEMNRPADAIAVFTKLTEDYPELPEPYNNLAVLYAQQKQYDKARTALEMAIRTHPSYAIAYENLGDVYAKLASQAYDKALQLDNANTTTQNKLALIRDLITTSGKGNVKPTAPTTAAPTASIIATTPAASAPMNADSGSNEVAKAIAAWASAWSSKDFKSYLSAYSPDFIPPKGMSRKAWEAGRENRIAGKPGKISITYDEPKITINADKATAKFRQHYSTRGQTTSTSKTLIMVRSSDKWLIKEEISR